MTRRARSSRGLAGVLLAWLLALAPEIAAAQGRGLETAVKAAFLTKFPAFVEWRAQPLGPADPLVLCIVGRDPFGRAVEQALQVQAGGRAMVVRRMAAVDGGSGCHMVYAGGSARQSTAEILQAVRGAPVLTVTDSARSGARGMIHFVVFQDRVRFHIDGRQAEQNGLSVSSKLLALGLSVRR